MRFIDVKDEDKDIKDVLILTIAFKDEEDNYIGKYELRYKNNNKIYLSDYSNFIYDNIGLYFRKAFNSTKPLKMYYL